MDMPKILVVDDEEDLCEILKFNLEIEGYEVDTAFSAEEALKMDIASYQLLLLDVMMGEISGFKMASILKKEEKTADIPIIFLTAKSIKEDILEGFKIGADDYITKPFKLGVLVSRVNALLRRAKDFSATDTELQSNGIKVLLLQGQAFKNGELLDLTAAEYKLLCLLAKNTGKVLTHNYLLNEVWGSPAASDTPSLRVFMATLRKKIEEDPSHPRYIQTHIGVGYRMIRQ